MRKQNIVKQKNLTHENTELRRAQR